jgi:hypothetical protein
MEVLLETQATMVKVLITKVIILRGLIIRDTSIKVITVSMDIMIKLLSKGSIKILINS